MTALVAAVAAFLGLISGYFLRDLIEARRRRQLSREGHTMKRLKSQTVRYLALGLVVVLLLAEGLALIKIAYDSAAYTRCTATWQQQFSDSYTARTEAAGVVSAAMDDVVTAVYKQDPEKFKTAIANYVEVRKEQNEARARNPLPDPPEEVCGTPGGTR